MLDYGTELQLSSLNCFSSQELLRFCITASSGMVHTFTSVWLHGLRCKTH